MSYFMGDDGKRYEIFRHGGGEKLAQAAGVPCLGEIPIDPRVVECGDNGDPIVHKYPDAPVARSYQKLAQTVIAELEQTDRPEQLPGLEL
jgi:ATP-binding protein involved in chromosome partitioning